MTVGEQPLTAAALAAMLGDQTEACALARHALLAGGRYEVFEGPAPANRLVEGYGGRLKRRHQLGLTTVGGDETLAILRRLGDQPLRVVEILPVDRSWYYQLYLDPEATRVLACAGHHRVKPEVNS